jgi:hypothetical protein
VSKQLGISRVVLSSMELVSYKTCSRFFQNIIDNHASLLNLCYAMLFQLTMQNVTFEDFEIFISTVLTTLELVFCFV